jgi:serine/threonine-protein kinase
LTTRTRSFGKYLLLDRIGAGGMAEIFRARQFGAAGFQKDLVIKKILPHLADNDDFVRMFIDEAKLAVTLQHNNIVQIFDLGAVGREYFIAMEYVAGKDLLNLLIRCTHLRIRVPRKLCVHIAMSVLRALEAAHSAVDGRGNPLNIIHRDVSPSNVLIRYGGTVKLGDFGVAKALSRSVDGEATRSGTMKGKLGYMSPEQVMGKGVDARSDLFGVGIILYELLAMNRLFKGDSDLETMMMVRDCETEEAIDELPEDVPGGLRHILRKALARSADDRFQTATAFGEALADHLFETKQRVSTADLGRFMRSVFAKEIEEENARRDAIEKEASKSPHISGSHPAFLPRPTTSGLGYSRSSVFRVRRQDGKVTEPMGLTAIMQLLDSGALDDADLVSIDDGPFRTAQNLAAILHGEAPDASRDQSPQFSGRFSQHDFPRLLYRYAATRATGRMLLACDGLQKEIFWRTGRPEYVTSTARKELLGEYLVQRELITRPQLNDALAILPDFNGRLGDALVETGAIDTGALFQALGTHIKSKLLELFSWQNGVYAFFTEEQSNTQIMPLDMSAYTLINEAVRNHLPSATIERYINARAHMPLRVQLHRVLERSQLGLTTLQTRLWPKVVGEQTLGQQLQALRAEPGVPEENAARLLYLMERLEFVAFG